jgi:hypothetical protein
MNRNGFGRWTLSTVSAITKGIDDVHERLRTQFKLDRLPLLMPLFCRVDNSYSSIDGGAGIAGRPRQSPDSIVRVG